MAFAFNFLKFDQLAVEIPDKEDAKKNHFIFLSILLTGFLLRVIVCFFVSELHVQRDTLGYIEQADTLLAGGYTNYFPNGFPFIIALSKLISADHYVTVLLWINIFLSTATIYFIYHIVKKASGNITISLLAAFILAVFPTQINYVRWILSETPSTFFLAGFFFFYIQNKNFTAGLFIGLASIIRTELFMILPFVMLTELLAFKKIRIFILAGLLIPILLTGFYCKQKTGKFAISGHGKVNTAYSVTASGSYIDWYYLDKHPEIKTSNDAMKMYIQSMKANPAQFIKNRSANFWELWGFFPSSSSGNRGLASRILIGLTNLFLLSFGLFGWWKQRKNFSMFILIFPFLVITAVHIMMYALPRYTYPAEPFLIVLSSFTLFPLIKNIRSGFIPAK